MCGIMQTGSILLCDLYRIYMASNNQLYQLWTFCLKTHTRYEDSLPIAILLVHQEIEDSVRNKTIDISYIIIV